MHLVTWLIARSSTFRSNKSVVRVNPRVVRVNPRVVRVNPNNVRVNPSNAQLCSLCHGCLDSKFKFGDIGFLCALLHVLSKGSISFRTLLKCIETSIYFFFCRYKFNCKISFYHKSYNPRLALLRFFLMRETNATSPGRLKYLNYIIIRKLKSKIGAAPCFFL